MRGSCIDCVRKHIAQASVLMDEAKLGYPHHRWFAAGHLAEAESEIRGVNLPFAKKLRKARIQVMSGSEPNFDTLIIEACQIAGDSQDVAFDDENSKVFDVPIQSELE